MPTKKATYYLVTPSGRQPVRLGERLGGGGGGDIFLNASDNHQALKIYHDEHEAKEHGAKLRAMISNPPKWGTIEYRGRRFTEIAWPSNLLESNKRKPVGFAMPAIDRKTTVILEDLIDEASRDDRGVSNSYYHRVLAAANLASVLTALHERGHYVVDLKPENILVYTPEGFVCLVDCDGFAIRSSDGRRFPAERLTASYRAPEFIKNARIDPGEQQDLFALAVVIFQLLNDGQHPFVGHATEQYKGLNIDQRVAARLYAYGRAQHPGQSPHHLSMHEYFEDSTRVLFDRAFQSQSRPRAEEWRLHLSKISDPDKGILRKCHHFPNAHVHFSRGCMHCAIEAAKENYARTRIRNSPPKPGHPATPHAARSKRARKHQRHPTSKQSGRTQSPPTTAPPPPPGTPSPITVSPGAVSAIAELSKSLFAAIGHMTDPAVPKRYAVAVAASSIMFFANQGIPIVPLSNRSALTFLAFLLSFILSRVSFPRLPLWCNIVVGIELAAAVWIPSELAFSAIGAAFAVPVMLGIAAVFTAPIAQFLEAANAKSWHRQTSTLWSLALPTLLSALLFWAMTSISGVGSNITIASNRPQQTSDKGDASPTQNTNNKQIRQDSKLPAQPQPAPKAPSPNVSPVERPTSVPSQKIDVDLSSIPGIEDIDARIEALRDLHQRIPGNNRIETELGITLVQKAESIPFSDRDEYLRMVKRQFADNAEVQRRINDLTLPSSKDRNTTPLLDPPSELMRKIQYLLQQAGYNPGAVDGVTSEVTCNAILAFKRNAGMTMNCIVDQQLEFAIRQKIEASEEAGDNQNLAEKRERALLLGVETELGLLGYEPGPADGIFDSKTCSALAQFQTNRGLPRNCDIDIALLAILEASPRDIASKQHSGDLLDAIEISGSISDVLDTGNLVVASSGNVGHSATTQIVRLRGVEAQIAPQFVAQLFAFIHSNGGGVSCWGSELRGYVCHTANGRDIGAAVIRNGAGTAASGAPRDYYLLQQKAEAEAVGIWQLGPYTDAPNRHGPAKGTFTSPDTGGDARSGHVPLGR